MWRCAFDAGHLYVAGPANPVAENRLVEHPGHSLGQVIGADEFVEFSRTVRASAGAQNNMVVPCFW